MKVLGQKIVQLQIAFIILGNADKAGLCAISKIDAQNRFDAKFGSLSNKIQSRRSIVDVSEHQLGHVVLLRQLQEFLFGESPKSQAIICVAV